jgi:chemotaxis methyl-accepting protein methylase
VTDKRLVEQLPNVLTVYRVATVVRRVQAHMETVGVTTPDEYLEWLQMTPDAAHGLLQKITIKVSSFFRNPVTFETLRHTVLPELVALRGGAPLRIWSAGCGRGEEAYSLAMVLEDAGVAADVLATDIDEAALSFAARGVYDVRARNAVPTQLGERFLEAFPDDEESVQVSEAVRARVRFARHDVTSDAPPGDGCFDLLCCRNMLIYLQRDVHQQVLRRLRGAVVPGGYLCLGEAEWPSPAMIATLTPLHRKTRLFRAL